MKSYKYTCLLFGEGKRDKDFIYALTDLKKFKYHTKKWHFTYDNAHGCSASDVIKLCKKTKTGEEDVILCFIDLDDLKSDYAKNWKQKKKSLEEESLVCGINIIWQIDKAEDEYKRVLGGGYKNKNIRKVAKDNVDKFINSEFWKRILNPIVDFEKNNKK